MSTNHRKTAFKLAKSVARLCGKYGIERVGFLTLTFAEHVTCAKEAGRRFNSLRTGVLAARYVESICVLERMKSGRIHFHLLVVLSEDIRTGFDFAAAAREDYRSANDALRAEWAFWRRTAKEYGFGRTELLPVKSNEDGLSKYVGKYIAKHVGQREDRDKGVRLVRYSKGASIGSNAFMFVSPRSRLWRWQVGEFARVHGCVDLDALKERFGPRWAYSQAQAIMALEPPPLPVAVVERPDGPPDVVTLFSLWELDRMRRVDAVAAALGCDQREAFVLLYQPQFRASIEFDAPRWKGEPVPRSDFECGPEPVDVTTVWAGGHVERVKVSITSRDRSEGGSRSA